MIGIILWALLIIIGMTILYPSFLIAGILILIAVGIGLYVNYLIESRQNQRYRQKCEEEAERRRLLKKRREENKKAARRDKLLREIRDMKEWILSYEARKGREDKAGRRALEVLINEYNLL